MRISGKASTKNEREEGGDKRKEVRNMNRSSEACLKEWRSACKGFFLRLIRNNGRNKAMKLIQFKCKRESKFS